MSCPNLWMFVSWLYALSNVYNICIVSQMVSSVQPKGIKVSKDQDTDKENKSEKVFIPFNAIRTFSSIKWCHSMH